MSNFIPTDRKTDYLLPPSVDDWLTQDHLARFGVEVIDGLDLYKLTRQYAGRGSKAHHPATLLTLLVYGYSTGIFSSRKLEMATEMKLLKLGTVCLDGTKIRANASRHSALSHGHIFKLEAQLRQEVQCTAGTGRRRRYGQYPRWHEPTQRTQTARRPPGRHGHGQGQDRSTCSRALRPLEGRV